MNSWLESVLQTPLDLSGVLISEPGAGLLLVATKMTTVRGILAVMFGLISAGFIIHAWMHRASLIDVIWPHAVMIPFFGILALVMGLGSHEKLFDANAHTLTLKARLGPLAARHVYPLPAKETLKLTFRKVYPTRGSGKTGSSSMPVRWYDIQVDSFPGASFTIASDRTAARAFAEQLAATLHWPVADQVEDDGVERIPLSSSENSH